MLAIDLNMADIFQPVDLLSFLLQTADPIHESDTCVAASNVMFLIAAPIDCALQISDTCSSIESSLLNGAASVFTIKISIGACCMIRRYALPPSIYGRLSGIKGSFFSRLISSSIAWHLQLLHFPLPQQIFTTGNSLRMVQAFLLEEFVRLLLCPLLCFYTFWCFFCFLLTRSFFFSFTPSGTSIIPKR